MRILFTLISPPFGRVLMGTREGGGGSGGRGTFLWWFGFSLDG